MSPSLASDRLDLLPLRPPRWVALALWLCAWTLLPWALQYGLEWPFVALLVLAWVACRWAAPTLERYADRVVLVDRRGRRTYRFTEVVSMGVVASHVRQRWTLKARFENGDEVTFWGLPIDRAAVLMDSLAAVLEARTIQALACGETVAFTDPRKVPRWFGWAVPLLVASVSSLGLSSNRDLAGALGAVGGCIGFYGAMFVGAAMLWSLAVWFRTRKTRGLLLGPEGFRLGRMGAPRSPGGAVFRGARGEAGGWIPWSSLRHIAWDGHGVTLTVAGIEGPVQLTEETQNLPVIARVFLRKMRGM